MMSSYVCRQCRALHIRRFAVSRSPQWQPRATFVSLQGQQRSTDTTDSSSQAPNGTADSNPEEKLSIRHTGPRIRLTPAGSGRYSRYAQASPPEELTAAVQDTGHAATLPTELEGPSFFRIKIEGSPQAIYLASLLKGQTDQTDQTNQTVDQAWNLFLKTYTSKDCESLTRPSKQDSQLISGGVIFRRLLDAILDDFCKRGPASVSPTEALFKYEQLDLFSLDTIFLDHPEKDAQKRIGTAWSGSIAHLTDQLLIRLSGVHTEGPNAEIILAELLSVWKLFFQCRGPKDTSLTQINPKWQLLDHELARMPFQRDIRARLGVYHPKHLTHPALAFSALTIFNILNETKEPKLQVSKSLRDDSMPFFQAIAGILRGGSVQHVNQHLDFSETFKRLPQEHQDKFLREIAVAPRKAAILAAYNVDAEGVATGSARARNQEEDLQQHFLKIIERSIKEQAHTDRLVRIWHEVVQTYTKVNNKTPIPQAIYNAFLAGYLVLRAPDQCVKVWNHMIAQQVKPDVRAWTAMLTGCEKARDLNGLKAMWERMVRSGTQPDQYAWTSRVHGLISLRQIQEGLAAMDEMGRQWTAAEQAAKNTPKNNAKNTPDVPKPSIEVINGAISAIVQLQEKSLSFDRKTEYARRILQWATNFSIKPDARTYNNLIQLYISRGDHATTANLLKQMEAEGLEADLATYTMLIRASFDNDVFGALSSTEQASRVTTLLSDLEERGLKLNAYIYSSVIDRLLKQYQNFTAVRAVVDHMQARGMRPSPHIYTSMITHYFQESPPNIEAVDGLWHQILSMSGTPSDRMLFDRVIEGYASVGEIGKMMAVLTVMSKHGKVPSWVALTAVVEALARAGEWERARGVVRDVWNGEGVAQGDIPGGTHGHKHFLYVVENLRILEPDAELAQRTWNEEVNDVAPVFQQTPVIGSEVVARPVIGSEVMAPPVIGSEVVAPLGPVEDLPVVRDWQIEDNGSVGGVPL